MATPTVTGRDVGSRRFEFRECLGRGGFGEVYRAIMYSPGGLQSDVAVKILRNADPDAIRRLRDEGRLLATLRHPGILRVHDLALLDGNIALVTEYVEGADLAVIIGPDGLSPRAVVEVIGAVADALHATRTVPSPDGLKPLDLVHRDIKPSNIRIGRHGEVKLLDFGIAWSETPDREAHTRGGSTVGSLPYMAPERFGRGAALAASDVYGLGCAMFEGLVGERLYPDVIPVEMYQRAANQALHDSVVAERLTHVPPLDPRLHDLLSKMLAFAPAGRPDAGEVAHLCERIAEDISGVRLRAWVRDRRWGSTDDLGGGLSGRVMSEQLVFSSAEREIGTPAGVPRAVAASGDTIDMETFSGPEDLPAESVQVSTSDVVTGADASLPPVPAIAGPSSSRPIGALIFGLIGAAAIVMAAGVVVVGLVSAPDAPQPPVAPVVAPVPVPEPPKSPPVEVVAEPPPAAVTAEPPPIAPPPVSKTPRLDALRLPTPPAPVEPPAQPLVVEPPKVEAPPKVEPEVVQPPGTLRVTTGGEKVDVELRGSDGKKFGPGSVPPGRYEVWANLYGDFDRFGDATIRSGSTVVVKCNKLLGSCTVE